jgi:hypothetical protein
MSEGAVERQPEPLEQGSTPPQKQDSGWNEHAAALAGTGNAEAHVERPGSPESRGGVEQRLENNVRDLQNNLEQIGEYKPANPVSEETKGKLAKLDEWLSKPGNNAVALLTILSIGGSAAAEVYNLVGSGPSLPPGKMTLAVMSMGAMTATAVKGGIAVAQGIERFSNGVKKLGNLIDENVGIPIERKINSLGGRIVQKLNKE